MYRPYLVVSLKISTAIFVAASLTAGCKDDAKPTSKVVFDSNISRGTHKAGECDKTGVWVTIGSFGTPAAGRVDPNDKESALVDPPRPVENGGDDQLSGGSVDLSCSVVGSGDGFNVRATATLSNTAVTGSVTVIGFFKPTGDQTGITLSVTRRSETYTENGCVAKFDAAAGQGIAAGRVWATIDCANATYSNDPGKVCATHAEIRLENCSQ